MKYEMIFGDEKLFDGAPEECILAVRIPGGDPIFYLENHFILHCVSTIINTYKQGSK